MSNIDYKTNNVISTLTASPGHITQSDVQKLSDNENKFKLTPTWLAYGDSYTTGAFATSWVDFLETKTNTTAINKGTSGTTLPHPAVVIGSTGMEDLISDTDTATYSTIFQYGVNDYRSNAALFANYYLYGAVATATYMTAALPQSKIINLRTDATRAGTWTDSGFTSTGLQTSQIGASLSMSVTGRYIAVRFMQETQILADDWVIAVDGTTVSNLKSLYVDTGSVFRYCYCAIIDMGTSATRTVSITNEAGNTLTRFVDFVCGYEENDTLARNVLVISSPFLNDAVTNPTPPSGAGSYAQWSGQQESVKRAVQTLSRNGLPVYYLESSLYQGCFVDDEQIHWSANATEKLADDIVNIAINRD